MSNNKMKGLLKGLRYISQIFDSEKEPEMQIGFPTDVKHVAHIGWDGPSVNSPSWMNEFKTPTAYSSAPLNLNGDLKEDASVKWVSQDSSRRGTGATNSPVRDLPELPKSSRRQSLILGGGGGSVGNSPTREKSEKTRSKKSSKSKESSDSTRPSRQSADLNQCTDSPTKSLSGAGAGVPKKSRRKKSKDSSVEGSTRSRSKAVATDTCQSHCTSFSDPGSDRGSVSRSKNDELLGEDGVYA